RIVAKPPAVARWQAPSARPGRRPLRVLVPGCVPGLVQLLAGILPHRHAGVPALPGEARAMDWRAPARASRPATARLDRHCPGDNATPLVDQTLARYAVPACEAH